MMPSSASRLSLLLAVGALCATLDPHLASAAAKRTRSPFPLSKEMPLDSQIRVPPDDPVVGPADLASLGPADRAFAAFMSRVEIEGKIVVPGDTAAATRTRVASTRAALDALAGDPALAARTLGPRWRLQKGATWDQTDAYLDDASKGYPLIVGNGGARKRALRENGAAPTRQELNLKLTGEPVLVGTSGVLIARAELGLYLGMNPDLDTLAKTESHFNPYRYGGLAGVSLAEVLMVRTNRARYLLQRLRVRGDASSDTDWEPLVDVTADRCTARCLARADGKIVEVGRTVHFAQLEAELLHRGSTGDGQASVAVRGGWRHPHKIDDLRHMAKDPNVGDLDRVIRPLAQHAGLPLVRAASKARVAFDRLGLGKKGGR